MGKPQYIYLFLGFLLSAALHAQITVGVLLSTPEISPGYTLFAPNHSTSTFLIDEEGFLVKKWDSEYQPSLSSYLLNDGSLLRAAQLDASSTSNIGGFQKFSWEGELVWEYFYGDQHHDIEPLPNGNILMITTDLRSVDSSIAQGRDSTIVSGDGLKSVSILEIHQTGLRSGEIVWEWHAWDHLIQDFDSSKANYGKVVDHPELIDLNFGEIAPLAWLHTNSVDYHDSLNQILLSNRSTNDLWIIDHGTSSQEAASHAGGARGVGGDLLYRWGNPASYRAGTEDDRKFYGQHDVQWIEPGVPDAGDLLIFNNGLGILEKNSSFITEIESPLKSDGKYEYDAGFAYGPVAAVWEYRSDSTYNFNSKIMGGVQRLPNGNTLICSALDGRFFEVSPAGEVVWIYVSPVTQDGFLEQGEEPRGNVVARCHRYAPDFPGFLGKDLTPLGPIDSSTVSVYQSLHLPTRFKLNGNFPNPFNPSTRISFSLAGSAPVTLAVYDILGREVITLFTGMKPAGDYFHDWNGLSQSGQQVNTGIYFARLVSGHHSSAIKMLVSK